MNSAGRTPGPPGGSARPFPLGRTARIAVFASGRGSNLGSLLRAFPPDAPGEPLARLVLVVSNRPGAPALRRADEAGVPTRTVPWTAPRSERPDARAAFEEVVQEALDEARIDLVCLAGFMRLLSPEFTARWSGRMVNVHPSLLPSFRGLHAQRQALEAGALESGCTIHLVDQGVDTGRVLLQRRVEVRPDDSVEALSDRILAEEHLAYPEAVRALLRGEAAAPTNDAGAAHVDPDEGRQAP